MIRVTPKDAQDMKDAYAKMYAPKEEPTEIESSAQEPADEEPETYGIRDYDHK